MTAKRTEKTLSRISTRVPRLDEILGGGIPEFSANVIAGPPGAGKTILAQQIGFGQKGKVLYISTLSEPSLKVIRYQSQFSFFDEEALDKTFFYRTIADTFKEGSLNDCLRAILLMVDEINPQFVFIDSFKAISSISGDVARFRQFVYDLVVELTSREITSFFIGEYTPTEFHTYPIFSVADGIFFLSLAESKDTPQYLEVRKLRGSAFLKGKHPFEISHHGITCFPHPEPSQIERRQKLVQKLSTNMPGLDEMCFGGFYEGSTTIIAGSAGTGKTSLAIKFLGHDGLLVSFEEKPGRIERYTQNMQLPCPEVLYISPVQFIPERATELIKLRVLKTRPKRIVIDGASEILNDKDVLYDLFDFLAQQGITTIMIYEIRDVFGTFSFTPTGISRLVDNVILLRYVELDGKIERILALLKMRGSPHDRDIRFFEIAPKHGLHIGQRVAGQAGLMTGVAQPIVHVSGEELAHGLRF